MKTLQFGILLFSCLATQLSAHAFDQMRTIKVNLESQYLTSQKKTGAGVRGDYLFNLSPKFSLGINAGAFYQANGPHTTALQYGLTLSHLLPAYTFWNMTPFVRYGLIMQATMIQGRKSYASSHDTLLGAGLDFNIGQQACFLTLDYHYDRIKYFDVDALNFDHLSFGVGLAWSFPHQP